MNHTRLHTITLLLLFSMASIPFHIGSAVAKKEEVKPIMTVRYSYQKQTRDAKRYVLVPVVEQINGEDYQDFKKRQKALFLAMKADKKANYGKTGFNVEGDVVLIFLDESKVKNHPFMIAEAVYTFTENGARAVKFPNSQYANEFTRQDITYPAYQLILPYWEGLPPRQLTSGILSLDDGSFLTITALKEQVKAGTPALVEQLVKTLKEGEPESVKAIVAAAEDAPLKGIEEGFIPLLESAQVEIRLAALRGLKGRAGKKLYTAIRATMDQDPDESVKDAAALVLSEASDPKIAVAAQFHQLRSKDLAIALRAVEQLVEAKVTEATDQLLEAVKRPEEQLRTAVIAALVKRKEIKLLVKQLESELSMDVKIEIAQTIRSDKAGRSAAYQFLVTQPSGEAASRALQDLRGEKLKGEIQEWLKRALRHPDSAARQAAAEVLSSSQDKTALEILKNADIEDAESGQAVHAAMRSIYAGLKDKDVMKAASSESQVSLRSAATGTLGLVYTQAGKSLQPKIFQLLLSAVQDKQGMVRAEAARSLADVKSAEALAELMKLKADSEISVKRSVATAGASYSETDMRPVLLGYLKETDPGLLEAALLSLGALKSVEAIDEVSAERLVAHEAVKVRRAAMTSIASIATVLEMERKVKLTTLLNVRLSRDQDSAARRAAVKALSVIPTEDSSIALSTQLQDSDLVLVKEIVDALAAHQLPASTQMLEGGMDHREKEIRAYTYQVAHQLKGEGLQQVVRQLFERRLKLEEDETLKGQLGEWVK